MTDASRSAAPTVILAPGLGGQGQTIAALHELVWGFDGMKGIGLSERTSHGLAWEVAEALHLWGKTTRSRRQPVPDPTGNELAPVLLRTAEEFSGFPCLMSWLAHGLGPAPASAQATLFSGATRLSTVRKIVQYYAGSGKTEAYIGRVLGRLERQIDGLLVRGLPPTTADLDHLSREAEQLALFLLVVMQRQLDGRASSVEYLVAVPPHASSPCGVLRLAVPLVPNAPGRGPFSGPTDFVLAA